LCGCAQVACHDVAIECGWRACVDRCAQVSTREPADAHLQGDVALSTALVNGKRVDFHVFDTSGSVGLHSFDSLVCVSGCLVEEKIDEKKMRMKQR
jgi:hypothetical protein